MVILFFNIAEITEHCVTCCIICVIYNLAYRKFRKILLEAYLIVTIDYNKDN